MTRIALALLIAATPLFAASAAKTAEAEKVTFSEHIAPIVFNNCSSCHREGQSAPFTLLNYKDVQKRGALIQAVTESRYMPPWHAAPNYGHFADEKRLTDKEIALIGKWVKAGMPEGDIAKLPELPEFPQGWLLGEPDLVVQMEEPYTVPPDGSDIYRNFVAATGTTEDKWVSAIEFRPGSRAAMHHSLFQADTSGKARERDARDDEPGFSGMDSGVRGVSLGGWAVGGNPRTFPLESPIKLPAGADFIFQSHFHPSGKVETEVSSVGIHFSDKPATRSRFNFQLPPAYGRGAGIDVPPGEKEFTIREQFTLPAPIELHSIAAHAHYIGKSFKSWAVLKDGTEVPLIHIPDWDFNWQDAYVYAKPVVLPAGATIYSVVTFDNSAENPHNPHNPPKRVTWGLSSFDEMGSVIYTALPVDEADAPELQAAYRVLSKRHSEQAREQMRNRKSTVRRSSSQSE